MEQIFDYIHWGPAVAKTPDITSREVREEPDSVVSQGTTIASPSPSPSRKPPLRPRVGSLVQQPPIGLDAWRRKSAPKTPPSESSTRGSILGVDTALQPRTTPRTVASQHLPMNVEGVSEEGEKPQVEKEVDETKHPEGDQPSEAVVEYEHELAIPTMPNSSDIDYLLERPDNRLQFSVNIVRNADSSSQPLLSHHKTCTREDDLPLMVHPVPNSSNFDNPGTSACKRLIGRAFSPQEVTSLIEAIFMSEDEVKMVRDLRGDDAQTFIDVIHEVCSVLSNTQSVYLSSFTPRPSNFHLPLIRLWISRTSNRGFEGRASVSYVGSVVVRPCFQDHCKSRFATVGPMTRYIKAGSLTCGRVNTKVATLQSRY